MARRRSDRRVRRRESTRIPILNVILIVVTVSILVAAGYIAHTLSSEPRPDAVTHCPASGPNGVLAILVDNSAPLSRTQAIRVRDELTRAINDVPVGTMVSIGAVRSASGERGAQIKVCKPETAESVSSITGNKNLVDRRFRHQFVDPIHSLLNELIGTGESEMLHRSLQLTELQKSLSQSGISIIPTDTELVLKLPERITFDVGSAQIRPRLTDLLSSIAQSLTSYPGTVIHVVGHTDALGTPQHNEGLSEERAAAVAAILVQQGVSKDRVTVIGRASHEPIAPNNTEEGRRTNRRVEIVITGRAPIMESLQALAADTPALIQGRSNDIRADFRKMLIVSNMLQNSNVLSFYDGNGWEEFQSSKHFSRLGTNLHGLSVEILRLPRNQPSVHNSQTAEHFWVRYFDFQGAAVQSRIMGDL